MQRPPGALFPGPPALFLLCRKDAIVDSTNVPKELPAESTGQSSLTQTYRALASELAPQSEQPITSNGRISQFHFLPIYLFV